MAYGRIAEHRPFHGACADGSCWGDVIERLQAEGYRVTALSSLDSRGFGGIPEDDFLGHFAADIDLVKAKVMYAVQRPLHTFTFDDVMGAPAWRSLPSWYLVAENDEGFHPMPRGSSHSGWSPT